MTDGSTGFRCSTCGQWHDDLPLDVAFDEPAYVQRMSVEERERLVNEDGDFQIVRRPDGMNDYFIRGVIEIPVHDMNEVFCYGAWTSLSERSYLAAMEAYRTNGPAGPFFGWLSNRIPGYPETLNLKTQVHVRPDLRARIELEPTEHPLAVEQRKGIDRRRVIEIVEQVIHPAP